MSLFPTTRTGITDPSADAVPARPSVPWVTVLPLAVVLSLADGYWVTSMRGAVGVGGPGPGPFTTWWHEAAVLLAAYVCAVLAAIEVARRWSGRGGRRSSTVFVAILLVALAATVLGVLHMATAAYADYTMQWDHLQSMTTMRGDCPPDCLEKLRENTMGLQVRAVTIGAGLLLVTNLGAVAWVTMCRGGRLDVAGVPRSGDQRPSRDLGWQLRWLVATALAGAALIHLAVMPEHFREWPAAGVFFVLLTAAEATAAVVVVRRPDRTVLLGAVTISAVPLVVWAWSRAVGLPFGPEPGVPEAIGLPDVAAVVLEVVALGLALVLIRLAPTVAGRPRTSDHLGRLASISVVAVTVVAVAATQQGWFDVLPPGGHG